MPLKDILRLFAMLLTGLIISMIIYNFLQGWPNPRPRPVYKMHEEIEESLWKDIREIEMWRKTIDECPVGGVRVIGNGLWRKERQLAEVQETKGGKDENH